MKVRRIFSTFRSPVSLRKIHQFYTRIAVYEQEDKMKYTKNITTNWQNTCSGALCAGSVVNWFPCVMFVCMRTPQTFRLTLLPFSIHENFAHHWYLPVFSKLYVLAWRVYMCRVAVFLKISVLQRYSLPTPSNMRVIVCVFGFIFKET